MSSIPVLEELKDLARLFREAGVCLYGVGGMVRNPLIGYAQSDLDVCSAMPPEAVMALCQKNGIACMEKAIAFGTVELRLTCSDGEQRAIEHTTFRADRYGGSGAHRPEEVHLGASLEEDAHRRDFTVNALYLDLLTGERIDPTGGLRDLEQRVLRATSEDPRTIMNDDGVRILRMVRFACELGFSIAPSTFEAARQSVAGLGDIAWERKRDELNKILLSDTRYAQGPYPKSAYAYTGGADLTQDVHAAHPVLRGLLLLDALGAIPYVVNELEDGRGVRQRVQYHAYDVLEHAFHACACAPSTLTLRLAGLLHDVGKPAALQKNSPGDWREAGSRTSNGPGGSSMIGHDSIGAPVAREMLQRLKYPKALVERVEAIVLNHMYDLTGQAKESTLRARFAQWGRELTEQMCQMREADVRGSGYELEYVAARWRNLLARMDEEGVPFDVNELQCTGADIMRWLNIAPGPQVGRIKEQLLKHCARHPRDNTQRRLEVIARGMQIT